ncbi:MAG: phosphoribosylamine--glycine ligase [Spirochaetales bacterium]|nr:phosphoribosylamine--glycine ligase [Spirochaetales bacterium]
MIVLVLGNGAREHALIWKLSQSPSVTELFAAPGNAGTAIHATNLPLVDILNPSQVVQAARQCRADVVFVGSEAPLEAGVVDALQAAGISAIGPDQHRAQLESSKVFSKEFMVRNRLPTAEAREFTDYQAFEGYVTQLFERARTPSQAHAPSGEFKLVIKKSGLAQGKGVLEASSADEALSFGKSILASDALLVEEYLTGFEISVFVLSDGKDWVVLPPTADFKKAGEGDTGPNTGGMGAICPVPLVTPPLWQKVLSEVVEPTMSALTRDNLNFCGILFIGLMMTAQGPKILEFNTRFGDPETQALLPLIESDFGELVQALAQGRLAGHAWKVSDHKSLGIVIAAPGYPASYPKNLPVAALPSLPPATHVFHATTTRLNDQLVTQGGRCFTAVATAPTWEAAYDKARGAARGVQFPGAWIRTDIGEKFFI